MTNTMRHHTMTRTTLISRLCIAFAWLGLLGSTAVAQQQVPSRVDLAWNRFYDYEEMTTALQAMVNAYPELLTMQSIGQSEEGREIWLVTLNNARTGPDTAKPAMWIDGNVHGNEVQASETVMYSIWYLTKSYGEVQQLTDLIDDVAFYFVPSVNPDGRAAWFREPNTPSTRRSGQRPTDNDFDGQLDEDGPEDLDGDGHIGTMWRYDARGTHRRNEQDPRIIERVPPGEDGNLSRAGSEGIDNDGDGRINEDGDGGYDMNRNWPGDWQPNYIQYGAGEYPLDRPETRCVAEFIIDHPNIAAGQSYHNTGGMLLRGPGAHYLGALYPRADLIVYDKLGEAGAEMLPFYRYMILHADLYTTHGGFVTWLHEGLGITSFTNELWSGSKLMQNRDLPLDAERRMRIQDRLLFGQTFTDWTEYDHPTLGKVLIGGGTKYASRTPPPFMMEEDCHRNFAFTMFHAAHMPKLWFEWIAMKPLDGDLWEITVEVANDHIISSRLEHAARKKIGLPDRMTLTGDGVTVVMAGTISGRLDQTITPVDRQPHSLAIDAGIPGESRRTFRFLVTGRAGASMQLQYTSEKARDIDLSFTLQDGEITPE